MKPLYDDPNHGRDKDTNPTFEDLTEKDILMAIFEEAQKIRRVLYGFAVLIVLNIYAAVWYLVEYA